MIDDGTARRIASEWHGGQTSGLYSFTSTGMIDDRVQDEVATEISLLSDNPDCTTVEQHTFLSDLHALAAYLEEVGHRTPVEGWHRVWA